MLRFLRVVVLTLVVGGTGLPTLAPAHADEQAPLISELTAPREVLSGADAEFVAIVQPELTGTVDFALNTYAGNRLWHKTAPIADGQASVVLTSTEAAELEKGSRVLIATAEGKATHRAYAPVRLRGRIFHNVTRSPVGIQPGDEIIITDMARLRPQEAISATSEKGKWWRRSYTIPGAPRERSLVCVEAQDLADPESCLAPQLSLPLKLQGWYEVWVRTYRHRVQGGVDVRLSGEKYFVHADPLQISTIGGKASPPHGELVDILYRAADLSGQSLLFQQPHGTFTTTTRLANASLAGVRLVKLSDRQVARLQAERAGERTRAIGFDNDGHGSFYQWGVHHADCIGRLLEPVRDQSVAFLNVELGGLGGLTIPTPYTGMMDFSASYTRDGDFRFRDFVRWCFGNNVNIADVLTDYAHEHNLKVFLSTMMERSFSRDGVMKAHPEWLIKRGRGNWDYAIPEVRDYQVKKIAWICGHYDIDGFIVDFTRYGRYFNEDEPNKLQHMNDFVRKLRAAVDQVNASKQRKCLLCTSFLDLSDFGGGDGWGTSAAKDQGLDVETWLAEGIFDIIMPEGSTAMDYVAMARSSRTELWPRKVKGMALGTNRRPGGQGPKEIEEEVKQAFDGGADGIFFFNHQTWTTLGRLGFKEELELRTKVNEIYGYRRGPVIDFATWHPNIAESNAQRKTFQPLTIATDDWHYAEGRLVIPLRNTFTHPVTASVSWITPEGEEESWTIRPAERSVTLPPGEDGHVSFRLAGSSIRHAAVPVANIEFSSEGQVVLRHRLPLRAVPQMICTKTSSPPTIDGAVSDEDWRSAGGLQPRTLLDVGGQATMPWETRMAAACDGENLYLAYDCSGVDTSKIGPEAEKRDSNDVYGSDNNLQILVDTAGAERAYLGFVVTPAAGQADYRAYYWPTISKFRTDRAWDAEWTARTSRRPDGYSVEVAIPFQALGATPKPGDVWRFNLVARSQVNNWQTITASWSSAEQPFHLPRDFGTLHGTLVFE